MSLRTLRLSEFGPFRLDPPERLLLRDGQPVPLSPKAYDLLVTLVAHAGHLMTKDDLLKEVWPGTFVEEGNLSYTVSLLRKALGDDSEPYRYIETVPKRGYRFKEPVAIPDETHSLSSSTSVSTTQTGANRADAPAVDRRRRGALMAALIMAAAILAVWLWSGSPQESLTRGGSPRIASLGVLPLKDLSGDPEQAYFVEGLHEALTTELSNIRALRVISPTSTLRYRDTTEPRSRIARTLKVDGLIDGSVLHLADRVRVTVQLIHGATNQILWAESYDRPFKDVLTLHMEVTRAIATQIQVTVTQDEARHLDRPAEVSPGAYRSYLQGNYHLARRTPAALNKAHDYFQHAIEQDPRYAPAHAGLALVLVQLGAWGGLFSPSAVHAPARLAAQKAIDLDPSLAEGHIALGRIKSLFEWDWVAADAAFRQGMQLGPSSSVARLAYANFLTAVGRLDESITLGRRTLDIDPLFSLGYQELGAACHTAGRLEEAYKMYRRALELDPEQRSSHFLGALLYLRQGKTTDAIHHLDALHALVAQDGATYGVGFVGFLYGKTDHRTEALRAVNELRKRAATEYVPASSIGHIYLGLNRHEDALREFERAFAQHDVWLVWLKVHPIYDEVRSHPRFQELLRRMKFPG